MTLSLQLFTATSALAQHPHVEINVPTGYKILGGGALDNWSGAGNLLYAAYPENLNKWVAAGKDHELASPATITGFAIALHDPRNEWDVVIESESNGPSPHPDAVATLPDGYTLTGGGARVQWTGAGNLLTASYPNGRKSWEARSKDHDISDPATITAYVIGLRHRRGTIRVHGTIEQATGSNEPHPSAIVCLNPRWQLTGGGALDNWNGSGNLLTASYPRGLCWLAAGKDHVHPSPATITSYAVGVSTQ